MGYEREQAPDAVPAEGAPVEGGDVVVNQPVQPANGADVSDGGEDEGDGDK